MFNMVNNIFYAISSKYSPDPNWDHWPFGPGYGSFWASALKIGFVALILGAILLYLRILFGPKGFFRDHELEKEAEISKQKELEKLEDDYKNKKISELDYKYTKKKLLK